MIAVIGCINAMWNQKSAAPFSGFVLTAVGGLILGALAAPLTLAIGVGFKVLAVVIGGVIWKARERLSPPQEDDTKLDSTEAAERWVLLPRGGTLLGPGPMRMRPGGSISPTDMGNSFLNAVKFGLRI